MFWSLYIPTVYFDVFILSYSIANYRWSILASMVWSSRYVNIINSVFNIA